MKVDVHCNFKIPDIILASAGTVNDLKEKIENYVGIKMEQQILRVKGSSDELAGDCFIRTLGPVGTSDSKKGNVDIALEITAREGVKILAKEIGTSGRSATLFANSGDTVNYLLDQFIGKDIQDYLMIYEGKPLKPSKPLSDYGLHDRAAVQIRKRIDVGNEKITRQRYLLLVQTNIQQSLKEMTKIASNFRPCSQREFPHFLLRR
ncbi:hypothetical protein WR25_23341 [Diploscapter pachys]|uniref:Ubiquitin-like domain-containing protein n=1 Tax=Diploscapter pachys TaxID=2018661 RepID=A0A2A2LHZ1_9BILA|nr:hypothetical protein WR25_23341 [Diploscapter pachys]